MHSFAQKAIQTLTSVLCTMIITFNYCVAQDGLKRSTININDSWEYLENNSTDINVAIKAGGWLNINLPHTWNAWDVMDVIPGYRRDGSWYRKNIHIDKQSNAQYKLYFEASNISTDVFVNGYHAGQHHGGYVGFEIDITKYIHFDSSNIIMVRVDNTYDPTIIPSQKADFFIYGGITRDVYLKIVPNEYIQNVQIATPSVSASTASTRLKCTFSRSLASQVAYSVRANITNASGQLVSRLDLPILSDASTTDWLEFPVINNPLLWSPNAPNLYQVQVELWSENKLIDTHPAIAIAYRWYEFESNGAFYLNGNRLLLRGTHRHEEHAGYGAAMTNEMHRNDISQIKEMGANFLRLGHYPQDPEVYKACNELGIIVWDELPWCRGGLGNDQWRANTERLFKEQILQNYNHPSIFFWSVGNEIYWLPDFENGDDTTALNNYVAHLNKIAHKLDPGRMTAIRKYYEGADLIDVFSPSIWSGWYAGVFKDYENALIENQQRYPRFLHMEYGGSSHVGRHTYHPITGDGQITDGAFEESINQSQRKNIASKGDWSESYIVDLFDWYLYITENKKDLSGTAQWAFKDFGTPLRPENPIPYVNQKGLVDRAGNPKDAYYVFKSYWSDQPFVYIESHTWTQRQGETSEQKISVFSNCDSIVLYHNGKQLSTKIRSKKLYPAQGLIWDVPFNEGINRLRAEGYINGNLDQIDSLDVQFKFGKPQKVDQLSLSYKILDNGNYLIIAEAIDKNKDRVLNYERPVYFSQDGDGKLLENYGTPTRSSIIQMANGYASIEFVPGINSSVIEVRNQDFKGTYLKINDQLKKRNESLDQIDP